MREDEEGLTIGVSDPTQLNTGKIRITLDRAVGKPVEENPKIRVLSTSPLSFEADVKDALGRYPRNPVRFDSIMLSDSPILGPDDLSRHRDRNGSEPKRKLIF